MGSFFEGIKTLTKEGIITKGEATKLAFDYNNIKQKAADINKKIQSVSSDKENEECVPLLKTLAVRNHEIQLLEELVKAKLRKEAPPII